MNRFPSLLAAALCAAPILAAGEAGAGCRALERADGLSALARDVIERPDASSRAALGRGLTAVGTGLLAGSSGETRTLLRDQLARLTLLSERTGPVRPGFAARVAQGTEELRDLADSLGCPLPKSREGESRARRGGARGDGTGAGDKAREDRARKTGLTMLGAGAMMVPALAVPALIAMFRKKRARLAERHPVRLDTQMRVKDETVACLVIDVSQGGACLVPRGRVPRDGRLWLTLPHGEVEATVRWRREGKLGVAFDLPLEEAQIERIRMW